MGNDKHEPCRHGFTLVELLVVIAIISILAAMLLPVLSKARDSAYATYCISNQKNMGTGTVEYTNDCNDFLPFCNFNPAFNAKASDGCDEAPVFYVLLAEYVGAKRYFGAEGKHYKRLAPEQGITVFTCPKHPEAHQAWSPLYYFYRDSYSPNFRTAGCAATAWSANGKSGRWAKSSGIKRPSMKGWLGPSRLLNDAYWALNPAHYMYPTDVEYISAIRHSDGANYLYFDGHVRTMSQGAIFLEGVGSGNIVLKGMWDPYDNAAW